MSFSVKYQKNLADQEDDACFENIVDDLMNDVLGH